MTAEDYRRELDSLFDDGLWHFGVPEGTWPEDGSPSDEEVVGRSYREVSDG